MAIYRNIRIGFWTDTKIVDDFTPEDKYFYLYLFTNPHTNLAGCYELSMKQASTELGYEITAIKTLLKRFDEVHKVIKFSEQTKEVLILNWHKYNWTSSEQFRKPLEQEISQIKDSAFKEYLTRLFNGEDTVSIPSTDGMQTTDTVYYTDTDTDTNTVKPKQLKAEFEQLWSIYPKKQGKDKAYGYYCKARKAGTTYEDVLTGINNYKAFITIMETDMQFVKMGSTFFSQKAWQDEYPIVKKSNNPFLDMLRDGGIDD